MRGIIWVTIIAWVAILIVLLVAGKNQRIDSELARHVDTLLTLKRQDDDSGGSLGYRVGRAAEKIGEWKHAPEVCVPALTSALEDWGVFSGGEWIPGNKILTALGEFGSDASSAVPVLSKMLSQYRTDPPHYDTVSFVITLARIGSDAEPAVPVVGLLAMNHPELQRLSLDFCDITEECIKDLANFKSLQYLSIRQTPFGTAIRKRRDELYYGALKKILPHDCEVRYY